MVKTEQRFLDHPKSETVIVSVVICFVAFCISTSIVGGCAVDGYFKVKASENGTLINEDDLPGYWEVKKTEGKNDNSPD